MAQSDLTTLEAAFKVLYPTEVIKNLVYKNNPFFALIPKDEEFYGESSKEPIIIGTNQNRSNRFANANVINTTTVMRAFLLTRIQNYATAAISNESMLASESEKGAFLKTAKLEMDATLLSLTRSICVQMYRKNTGIVARISPTAVINSASVPVQLAVPSDGANLEYGMSIAFSPTDGGVAESGTAFIVQIDHVLGQFLCSATPGGSPAALTSLVPTVAVSDYIYANAGDQDAALSGLWDWLPGPAATSTLFFGVNRAIDKNRLAGIHYDGSAQSIDEALTQGATIVASQGGRPDHCFMNYVDYANLVKSLGSKQMLVQYTDVKVDEPDVTVGFTSLMVAGPHGPLKVIPDLNAQTGFAYLLQLDTWKLKSLGDAVRLFNGDGLTWIRDPNADNLLIRCFSYAQMSCRAPGYNAIVKLPSA